MSKAASSRRVASTTVRAASATLALILTILMISMIGACSGNGSDATEGSGADTDNSDNEDVPKINLSQDSPNLAPDLADIQPDINNADQVAGSAEQSEPDLKPGPFAGISFDLFEGGTRTLDQYLGIPLVVNFFAAWCPPCVREMPEFQEVFLSLGTDVAFLGLSQDSRAEDALDLVEATGVTYDIGWDRDLEVYEAVGGLAMPTTAFISEAGELVDVFSGALNQESLIDRIEPLMAQPNVDSSQ